MDDIVSEVASNVRYAFHALSLHETREPFSPTYMRGPNVHQVFFVGNHGDMGWVDNHESFVHAPLSWMIQQLESHLNIAFDEDELQRYFLSYRHRTISPLSPPSLLPSSDAAEDLRQGAITTSPSTEDRDYPWATGCVSRPSSTRLAFIGKRVRRPGEIMSNRGKRRAGSMSENVAGSRPTGLEMGDNNTTEDAETAHLNVQVHIGARIYRESNAVPGYAIRIPTTGQFYWARQGNGQQPPWGTWFFNPRRSNSNSSGSQSPEQNQSGCPIMRSQRIARLSGSGAIDSGSMVVERIQEAAVGPRDAALLGLEAEVVSTRPCYFCSGSS
ncbi:hypothetical protein FSARC_11738 [Fusarium sarcochroum]|uniref:T6SS Phospholipase effector Tle1-like catalytic domain-containing protein n=1 Tax=Fusarium sarcochroum TaxID=1208366 RepID=A0A8H4WYW5_9HYPO|nr:hypothetical protein FSARC_11738 [Fusarium sarcochroum]